LLTRTRLGGQPSKATCRAARPEKTDGSARGSWGLGLWNSSRRERTRAHQENRQRASRGIQATGCRTMELKEALTANAIAEEEWEARAQLARTKRTLKKQSVVIWVPEPDLRRATVRPWNTTPSNDILLI